MADAIRNRSRDLLAHGYEWTLTHGEPMNQPFHQYKWAPACCNMSYDDKKKEFKVRSHHATILTKLSISLIPALISLTPALIFSV